MSMTPVVRYKNFNLENLKDFIKIYPYFQQNEKLESIYKDFDFSAINTDINGYKKTAYQFACQIGLQNNLNGILKVNDYLVLLNDEQLSKYLTFWSRIYYAPNPYVGSTDEPKIIWVDLCEKILESENLELDYYEYFHDNINDTIDVHDPKTKGSNDITLNYLVDYGQYIKKKDQRIVYIEAKDVNEVREQIEFIKKEFSIPVEAKDKNEFFNRFSSSNFMKMFPCEESKADKSIVQKIDFSKNFTIRELNFEEGVKKDIERRITQNLKMGKHIILSGPPGTGKSKLAKQICEFYEMNYKMTTASADWSTYETIGGYSINKEGTLEFNAGVFLSCFKDEKENSINKWLIIDEMNRADIDKAFGTFFSILAGDDVELNYKDDRNENIKVMNEKRITTNSFDSKNYIIPNNWRLIGTINTLDKASLFEMSYAFMRRFAIIPISIPTKIDEELVKSYLEIWKKDSIMVGNIDLVKGLTDIWSIINRYRPIGPAILKDMAMYVEEVDDWTSILIMFVLPQFEGADEEELQNFINELLNTVVKFEKNKIEVFVKEFFGIEIR